MNTINLSPIFIPFLTICNLAWTPYLHKGIHFSIDDLDWDDDEEEYMFNIKLVYLWKWKWKKNEKKLEQVIKMEE